MFVVFKASLVLIYIFALLGLAIYGLNNLITTLLYLRVRKIKREPTLPRELPIVTVQLPTYNERYTIERLLNAVVALDYPRGRLQIQVLDDSTDETAAQIRRLVEIQRARGIDIELIQRTNRSGFKSGALAEGMKSAKGELLAIFDADFIPSQDWLKKTVGCFSDPKLACLQTRWGHANYSYSLFTRAQALGIDGHFIIEQTARARNGLFLNFNGTAGLWRRAAIEDAGGWQPDTLTEDLDLSYRAQLKGWKIDYLPEVVVPAELPAQVEAFKKQQFRWAKGSFQVVRKMALSLLRADIPEAKRVMGLIHMTGYMVHPLMLLTLLFILPVGLISPSYLKIFPWTALTAFGPPIMYLASQSEYAPRLIDRLRLLPVLIMLGFGLSLNNTIAVYQGLFGRKTGTFARTPKFNLLKSDDKWENSAYIVNVSPMVWGEVALGFYALLSSFLLGFRLGWGAAPWLTVYVAGYFYVAGINLFQNWQSAQFHSARVHAA